MRAKQRMSRAEFMAKVDQLLAKFDNDLFMYDFHSGVNRSCDLIRDWVMDNIPVSVTRNLLLRRIREVKKVRR